MANYVCVCIWLLTLNDITKALIFHSNSFTLTLLTLLATLTIWQGLQPFLHVLILITPP